MKRFCQQLSVIPAEAGIQKYQGRNGTATLATPLYTRPGPVSNIRSHYNFPEIKNSEGRTTKLDNGLPRYDVKILPKMESLILVYCFDDGFWDRLKRRINQRKRHHIV
jgi:hypothetical protein